MVGDELVDVGFVAVVPVGAGEIDAEVRHPGYGGVEGFEGCDDEGHGKVLEAGFGEEDVG